MNRKKPVFELTWWSVILIVVILFLANAAFNIDHSNKAVNVSKASQVGGPYRPETAGGQALGIEYEIVWKNEQLTIIPPLKAKERSAIYTYSIEIPVGNFLLTGGCVLHLDDKKNGKGDLNPIFTDPVIKLTSDAWGLIEVGREVESCIIAKVP